MRTLIATLVLIAATLSGCVVMSAGPVTTTSTRPLEPGPKELTLLTDAAFMEELATELRKQGFRVASIPLPGRTATTRYGIRFNMPQTQAVCAFTPNWLGNATMTVVDTTTGESVAVLKQYGATGPCTTVDPVYVGLAATLSTMWKPT